MKRGILVGVCGFLLAASVRAPSGAAEEAVGVCLPKWLEELVTVEVLIGVDRGFFEE